MAIGGKGRAQGPATLQDTSKSSMEVDTSYQYAKRLLWKRMESV